MTVFGSYHIATPYAATYDHVVGIEDSRYTEEELQTIINGIYYEPDSVRSYDIAMSHLEQEFGDVDYLVFSSRASSDLGVITSQLTYPAASENYTDKYSDNPSTNCVYSNGAVTVCQTNA